MVDSPLTSLSASPNYLEYQLTVGAVLVQLVLVLPHCLSKASVYLVSKKQVVLQKGCGPLVALQRELVELQLVPVELLLELGELPLELVVLPSVHVVLEVVVPVEAEEKLDVDQVAVLALAPALLLVKEQ